MPKGKNKVRFELRGILYVDIDEFTYEIKNPYDYVPQFVEVVKVENKYYIKGFEPKENLKEIKYTKSKTVAEKE